MKEFRPRSNAATYQKIRRARICHLGIQSGDKSTTIDSIRRYNHVRFVPSYSLNPRTVDPTHSFQDVAVTLFAPFESSHVPDQDGQNLQKAQLVGQPCDAPASPVQTSLARRGRGSHASAGGRRPCRRPPARSQTTRPDSRTAMSDR